MAKELELGGGVVYITDQQNMVDIMSANINLNSAISSIVAAELDWLLLICFQANNRAATIPEHLASPDIVLAADCVYFEPAFPLLQDVLRKLAPTAEVDVYMAYKKRRKVLR
jgi:hypothetical protein